MADKEVAVSVKDIHKEFILPQSKNSTFKQTVVNIVKKNNKVTQKTLDGVSFDIHKGDFFGIVGRNGSGKSTLLKLIAGVYTPTAGNIGVRGGLTPFIELGVGFNPELSGRDNVYLNGALLGFTRDQMAEMYDEIVDFAELAPFMDQKLKNYSSGMQVRLAFSIAIKAKNDVLIFDEVLAVGDEAFQRKCLDVFEGYKASGQTVILVTHDMETVRQFCSRAVLIQDGKVLTIGSPRKVADKYSALNQEVIDNDAKRRDDSSLANYADLGLDVKILNSQGGEAKSFRSGTAFSIDVKWRRNHKLSAFVVNIFRSSGEHVTAFRVTPPGQAEHFSIQLAPFLGKGKYELLIEMRDKNDKPLYDSFEGASFIVNSQDIENMPLWSGMIYIDHKIKF